MPNKVADVIVVGAGNAAFCAALAAQEEGAKVVMCEAAPEDESGGNSRFTAGSIRVVYDGVDDINTLVPRLNAISQENHDAKIYIRGDKGNSWGTMMDVLGAVGGAGYTKVGLISSPTDGTQSKRK